MDKQRKSIILKEIQFWKESRMLPEHYCDFLTALYTEGEQNEEPATNRTRKRIHRDTWMYLLIIIILMSSLVLTYFTELSFLLQTVILSFFVLILVFFTVSFHKTKKNPLLSYISTAFIALLFSVEINENFFPEHPISLYVILGTNVLAWIVIGIWRKIAFFTISGLLALLFLLVKVFNLV